MYGILTYIWNEFNHTGHGSYGNLHVFFLRILGGAGAEDAACPITGAICVQWKVGWMWRGQHHAMTSCCNMNPNQETPYVLVAWMRFFLSSTFSSRKPNFRFFWILIIDFHVFWFLLSTLESPLQLGEFHRHSYIQAMLQNNKKQRFDCNVFWKGWLELPSLKPTVCTWNCMVGRLVSFGMAYFQGYLSFWERNWDFTKFHLSPSIFSGCWLWWWIQFFQSPYRRSAVGYNMVGFTRKFGWFDSQVVGDCPFHLKTIRKFHPFLLLMEGIPHHLGCINACK